jgi:hypothetical protein
MKVTAAATISAATLAGHAPADMGAGVFDGDFEGVHYGEGLAMQLEMLTNTETTGAVCLDGTPGGFYVSKATGSNATNNWQLYFEGGGENSAAPLCLRDVAPCISSEHVMDQAGATTRRTVGAAATPTSAPP